MDVLFSVLAEPQQNLENRCLHSTKSVARNIVPQAHTRLAIGGRL